MYANRIFKGWRKDPVTGKTLFAFEDIPETTIGDALTALEKQQDSLREQLHRDQDRVEGQFADGSEQFPYIKPNKQTIEYRGQLMDEILGYEREKEYLKQIEYLINYSSLKANYQYRLNTLKSKKCIDPNRKLSHLLLMNLCVRQVKRLI